MDAKDRIENIKNNYKRAKELAKDIWIDGDHEGDENDFYYFQCGFVAGMNYNEDTKQN